MFRIMILLVLARLPFSCTILALVNGPTPTEADPELPDRLKREHSTRGASSGVAYRRMADFGLLVTEQGCQSYPLTIRTTLDKLGPGDVWLRRVSRLTDFRLGRPHHGSHHPVFWHGTGSWEMDHREKA